MSILDETISPPPDWRERALCVQLDANPDDWFPVKGQFWSRVARDAREACGSCPVRELCLAQAMELEAGKPTELRFGIWGGLAPSQRAAMDEGRQRPPATDPRVQGSPGRPAGQVVECNGWPGRERGIGRHRARGEELCPSCLAYDRRQKELRDRDERVLRLALDPESTVWTISIATGVPRSTVRGILARAGAAAASLENLALDPGEVVLDGQGVLRD